MGKLNGMTSGALRLAAAALLGGLLPCVAQGQTATTATLSSGLKPSLPAPSLTFSSSAFTVTRTMGGGTRTVTVNVDASRQRSLTHSVAVPGTRTLP